MDLKQSINNFEKILFCYGTRAEWLKIKPLAAKLKNCKFLFTGQHLDLIDNPIIDYEIKINKQYNRLNQIIADILIQFPNDGYDSVLVQGDTASAFACALAAFHRNKKIYYLEAGLRTYDLNHPYPEEGYRQMIARLSNINFCPTALSKKNLINENVKNKSYIVGNTILDNLVEFKDQCEYTNKILVTLHRRENHFWLDQWFKQLNSLAINNPNLEFILPIHPNPNVQKHRKLLQNINIIEPLPHKELINILIKCKLIITDSGGLQEEGCFFNKKIIVCRKTTDRPEAIKTGHLHMCSEPFLLKIIFNNLINNYNINTKCPYGDGFSALKIIDILKNL
jgi:UDP-N-acetylglucosamine 2-epimerase (non-hydrolysing)